MTGFLSLPILYFKTSTAFVCVCVCVRDGCLFVFFGGGVGVINFLMSIFKYKL